MKKNLVPLILIILGILGILITVYITKQQESLDIGDSAATATQYYVVTNLDNCPSGTTKNVDCFDVINSALGVATNKAFAKVTIKAGTYDQQANIGGTNTTNIEIHGEGNDKTFIKNTSNTPGKGILGNGHPFSIENPNATVLFADLAIDGTAGDSSIHVHNAKEVNAWNIRVVNSKAAGIYYDNGAKGTVNNSYFEKNTWPGVSIHGNANVIIKDSTFKNHVHSGIDVKDSASVNIRSCNIADNTGKGLSIYDNSNVTISGSTVKNSETDYTIATFNNSTLLVNGSIIFNPSRGGIAIWDKSELIAKNNIINDTSNGLVFGLSSKGTVINNTFVNSSDSGIDLNTSGNVTIKNNILNKSKNWQAIYAHESNTGTVTVSHNCFWDNPKGNYYSVQSGAGDISQDPKFVSSTDFHLKSDSPAINAGDPDSKYDDPDGSRNDIGAYGGNGACGLDSTLPGCVSICTPNCSGKDCGGDGCGGSCGSCSTNESCINSKCISAELDCSNADINGTESDAPDGKITMSDISLVLANFKWQKSSKNEKADMNGPDGQPDGEVDMRDVSKVLACFRLRKGS